MDLYDMPHQLIEQINYSYHYHYIQQRSLCPFFNLYFIILSSKHIFFFINELLLFSCPYNTTSNFTSISNQNLIYV